MEKKLQKISLTYYKLFITQDLWQFHYQILSIIFLKDLEENLGEYHDLYVQSNTLLLADVFERF